MYHIPHVHIYIYVLVLGIHLILAIVCEDPVFLISARISLPKARLFDPVTISQVVGLGESNLGRGWP